MQDPRHLFGQVTHGATHDRGVMKTRIKVFGLDSIVIASQGIHFGHICSGSVRAEEVVVGRDTVCQGGVCQGEGQVFAIVLEFVQTSEELVGDILDQRL